MKISFLDSPHILDAFYPLVSLTSVEDLQLGIFSNRQRWEYIVHKSLGEKIEFSQNEGFQVHGGVVPHQGFVNFLKKHKCSVHFGGFEVVKVKGTLPIAYTGDLIVLKNKLDYLLHSVEMIQSDIHLLSPQSNITTLINDKSTRVYNPDNCYAGKNLQTHNCTLNAEQGPIYIGDNVRISEYAVVYGPAVILDHSVIGSHSKLRSGTVIGPNCYVSGELKNVLILGNSNKGHYGYLGDSIVGQYCNLGAGTSTSNLKNNFSEVRVFDKTQGIELNSGLQKVGSFIGDFSTIAVNTVLNTGSTVGVMCNVFGEVFYPKHLKDFSWGKAGVYHQMKFKDTARALLQNKGAKPGEIDEIIGKLDTLYNQTNR